MPLQVPHFHLDAAAKNSPPPTPAAATSCRSPHHRGGGSVPCSLLAIACSLGYGCGVDDPEGGAVPPVPCGLLPGGGVCGLAGGGVLAPFGGVGAPGVVPGGGVTAGFPVVAPGAPPAPAGGVPGGVPVGGPVGGPPGRRAGGTGGLAPGGGAGLVSLWLISSTSNTSSDFAGIGPLPASPYASWYGMNKRRLPPIFIPSNPVSHPSITWRLPYGKEIGSPPG